jgi:hypothetical protein
VLLGFVPSAGHEGRSPDAQVPGNPLERRQAVADASTLTDAERAKLEQRRDRLMKLLKDGGGEPLDADDRADLMQEWTKIDNLLQRR